MPRKTTASMPVTAVFRAVWLVLLLAAVAMVVWPGCTRSVEQDDTSPDLSRAGATAKEPALDDAPDQAVETSLQVTEMSGPDMANSSANEPTGKMANSSANEPTGKAESDIPPSQAKSQAEPVAAKAEPAAVPSTVLPPPTVEMESRHPLRKPVDDRRLVANPLRPNAPPAANNAEMIKPDSSATSETASDPAEQQHASNRIGNEAEPFDPIKLNGPIFLDWPKPKLALLISGRLDGYLEPCGCAGLDRMKGGLGRRHSLVTELRQARGWEVVGLDVGGMVKGFGRQAELKFQITVNAFRQMGYEAIGLGKSDLQNRATELLSVVAGEESPFHSANVGVFGFDSGFTNTSKIVEAAGLKLGITSVLGAAWQEEVNNSEIELADPETKLAAVLPGLGDCDLLILLAHATKDESIALAKKFPDFDIVVTAGGAEEPPNRIVKVQDTLLIEVGTKGMNVIVLGLFDDPETPYRYQRVPLDSRFADSADIRDLMIQYQQQLKSDGFAGLGLRKSPHQQSEVLGRFVGSRKCESCHEGSYKAWKKTEHAQAFESLLGARVPRQFDPECISCHVVGWHPNKYFPYESGFWSLEETPQLKGVGCESCHGPGEKHIAAENGGDLALQEKLQQEMTVTAEQAQEPGAGSCLTCHDGDNSPDFNFEEYWPRIEHHDD